MRKAGKPRSNRVRLFRNVNMFTDLHSTCVFITNINNIMYITVVTFLLCVDEDAVTGST